MSARLLVVVLVVVGVRVSSGAADPDPVKLRVGTTAIDGSRYMKDIQELGKEIERRTRGSVQLEWISGGQLGEEQAMADLIARGKLDGGALSEPGLVALVPEMAVWGLPGMFRAYEEVDHATTTLDASVRALFAKRDLVFAMWADLGFSRPFASERVGSVDELLAKAAPWLQAPLDGKLTGAISDGRARAWSVPPLYMLAIGTTNVRIMTNLRFRYVIGGLVLGRAGWSRLTPAQHQVVLEVCRDWEPRIRERWRKETTRGIGALEKAGIKTLVASNAEIAAFVDASAKSRAARANQLGLEELAAKVEAAVASP